jgi:putative MATE family efflux protein
LNILKDNIFHLIRKIAVPASVGFIFGTLYNVVDTYFAGQHISSESLAGLTYTFPLYLVMMAFGNGMATGISALVAQSLGKRDKDQGVKLLYNGFRLILIISALLGTFLWFCSEPLIELMGGSGKSLEAGVDYMKVIALAVPISMFSFYLNAILSVQGDTKSFRNSVVIAFILNCFLDPLFIMYFDWGVSGLAWATFIVQVVSIFYLLFKVSKSDIRKYSRDVKFESDSKMKIKILKQGLPSTLNMFTMSGQIFIMNYYVEKYAGEASVAGMGAAFRVEQLFLIPTLALNIAVMTIVGQNFGAQNVARIRETFKKSIIMGCVVIAIGIVFILTFGEQMIKFFDDTPEVVAFGYKFLRFSSAILLSYVITNVSTATMQSLQKPIIPLVISIIRRVLAMILLIEFLANYCGLGIDGFFYSILILPWIGVVFFSGFAIKTIKDVERRFASK